MNRDTTCSHLLLSPAARRGCRLILIVTAALTVWQTASVAGGAEYDGFTEPNRTVTVAAAETGTIKSIDVREGERVEKGQVLAQLDDDLYVALLAIADESMRAQGQLKSADAELVMRRQRLEKLEDLRSQGHARQEEVERARADVAIGEARVLSAQELLHVKRLEYDKVKVQLERRVIRSPLNGVVNILHKQEGEFVAPNDPHILQIVELDPLAAMFSVPSFEATHLTSGQTVAVYLEDVAKFVEGTVDLVAPVTDAESGTVRVKVRIGNGEGAYRSGERCTLQISPPDQKTRRGAAVKRH